MDTVCAVGAVGVVAGCLRPFVCCASASEPLYGRVSRFASGLTIVWLVAVVPGSLLLSKLSTVYRRLHLSCSSQTGR